MIIVVSAIFDRRYELINIHISTSLIVMKSKVFASITLCVYSYTRFITNNQSSFRAKLHPVFREYRFPISVLYHNLGYTAICCDVKIRLTLYVDFVYRLYTIKKTT